jgi:hypothetical protein
MMNRVKINRLIIFFFLASFLAIGLTTSTWAHGEGTTIVPVSLTAKAGSELEVKVSGLVGTKTATFRLTGMFGKFELGEYSISSDDFTQVLKIPANAQPGSYRLTVEGGGKSAKVVITVN